MVAYVYVLARVLLGFFIRPCSGTNAAGLVHATVEPTSDSISEPHLAAVARRAPEIDIRFGSTASLDLRSVVRATSTEHHR